MLTEVYKFLNGYSPDIINDVFHLRQSTYNLQNIHAFATDVPRNIACSISSLIGQINYGKPCPLLWKLILARIIQKRIKKLGLHWMSMSNLLKIYSWCWMHLIVYTSILFCRTLLAWRYWVFSTLNIIVIIVAAVIIIITLGHRWWGLLPSATIAGMTDGQVPTIQVPTLVSRVHINWVVGTTFQLCPRPKKENREKYQRKHEKRPKKLRKH